MKLLRPLPKRDQDQEDAIVAEADAIRANRAALRASETWKQGPKPADDVLLTSLAEFTGDDLRQLETSSTFEPGRRLATVGDLRAALAEANIKRYGFGSGPLGYVHGARRRRWERIIAGQTHRAQERKEAAIKQRRREHAQRQLLATERGKPMAVQWAEGATYKAIGQEHGISKHRVSQLIHRYVTSFRRRTDREALVALIALAKRHGRDVEFWESLLSDPLSIGDVYTDGSPRHGVILSGRPPKI